MKGLKATIKFVPVFVMAGLMISGVNALTAAPIATFTAFVVAMITEKLSFQELLDPAVESVSKIIVALFILMFAYAMASAFMSTGVGAAIVNISLGLGITAKTVAFVGFLVTCVLSVATGTSWGTFAACAPIFLWLNHIVQGDLLLTTAAIAGGACFGDNIGLISDTTVVSSGIQGVEVIHRIRHQGVWSIICLSVTAILFLVVGFTSGLPSVETDGATAIAAIPNEVWGVLQEQRPAAVDLLMQVKEGVPIYMITTSCNGTTDINSISILVYNINDFIKNDLQHAESREKIYEIASQYDEEGEFLIKCQGLSGEFNVSRYKISQKNIVTAYQEGLRAPGVASKRETLISSWSTLPDVEFSAITTSEALSIRSTMRGISAEIILIDRQSVSHNAKSKPLLR